MPAGLEQGHAAPGVGLDYCGIEPRGPAERRRRPLVPALEQHYGAPSQVGLRRAGIEPQRLVVRAERLLQPARREQRIAPPRVGLGRAGIEPQRPVKVRQGLFHAAGVGQQPASPDPGGGIAGDEPDRPAERRERPFVASHLCVRLSKPHAHPGVAGALGGDRPEVANRPAVLAKLHEDDAAQEAGHDQGAVEPQRLVERGQGLFPAAKAVQGCAAPQVSRGASRVQPCRLVVRRQGLFPAAKAVQGCAAVHVPVGAVRVQPHGLVTRSQVPAGAIGIGPFRGAAPVPVPAALLPRPFSGLCRGIRAPAVFRRRPAAGCRAVHACGPGGRDLCPAAANRPPRILSGRPAGRPVRPRNGRDRDRAGGGGRAAQAGIRAHDRIANAVPRGPIAAGRAAGRGTGQTT